MSVFAWFRNAWTRPGRERAERAVSEAPIQAFPPAAPLQDHVVDPAPASVPPTPATPPKLSAEELEAWGREIGFDEAYYLERNHDLAQVHAAGRLASPLEHFYYFGRAKGREGIRPAGSAPPAPAPACDNVPNFADHNGGGFLTPHDLTVKALPLKRIALVGSCLLASWGLERNNPAGCQGDLLVMNNADPLPDSISDGVAVSDYNFYVIQMPLRAIYHDTLLTSLNYNDVAAFEAAFADACERMLFHLRCRMEWNERHGLLAFVCNFLQPQRNPMGLLFPKYDLRNSEYFIDRLNERLEEAVREYRNAYVLDLDRLAASIGRRYVQDDAVAHIPHGAVLFTTMPVMTRIEPVGPMAAHYDIRWPTEYITAIWNELMAMYRVVRQADAVKLVVVDLDDTLWNGISGDIADIGPMMIEGWPIGVIEALHYLKSRGILLAIISKNEERRIREIFPQIMRNRLSLDDFAAVMVNWDPKAQSMQSLLDVVNLLPRNVVFIDDNPAERDAMKRAFPDMRIIGRDPYYVRRILLWSSETQVANLTAESARRTQMIQKQVMREGARKQMSREEFLAAAAPSVAMTVIADIAHPRFPRVFELVNKTNQFNTTGRRWSDEEFRQLLGDGGVCYTFEVTDKYTDYGLVGVVILRDDTVVQWVMSCRVLGYQVEEAVMATLVDQLRAAGIGAIRGLLRETDVNFPCRTLFSKCGFVADGDDWILPADARVAIPGHVSVRHVAPAH